MPASATAGQTIGPIAVEVWDKFGNPVLDLDATITLSIDSGPAGAALSVSAPLQGAIASFDNLSLTAAGKYLFTAQISGLPAVQSQPLVIAPAQAARIVIANQPISATTNQTMPPITAYVEDQFGNLVTNVSQISASLLSGTAGGDLEGTLSTFVNDGIAVFHNLFVTLPGTYILTLNDGNLPAVQTGQITAD
jgi:hypothetical protein